MTRRTFIQALAALVAAPMAFLRNETPETVAEKAAEILTYTPSAGQETGWFNIVPSPPNSLNMDVRVWFNGVEHILDENLSRGFRRRDL